MSLYLLLLILHHWWSFSEFNSAPDWCSFKFWNKPHKILFNKHDLFNGIEHAFILNITTSFKFAT